MGLAILPYFFTDPDPLKFDFRVYNRVMKVETLEKSSPEAAKASQKELKKFIKTLKDFVGEFYPREFEEFKNKDKARKKVREIENYVLNNLKDEEIKEELKDRDIGELTNEKRVYFFYSKNLDNPNIKNEKQIYFYCILIDDPRRIRSFYKGKNKYGEQAILVINSLFPWKKPKTRGIGRFAGTNKKRLTF